ncbi:SWIM zinc finger family protein, partial [Streptomyces sp. 15-116A]|uniref:SWIM zinc finger family protein n=1 Tax=Streptomyces sp. 15-116A TaxID=2259035 RepID=UPI0021B1ABD2
MTPRPSDQAREALRAARERENTEPRQPTGNPAPGQQGPAEAAREALRQALRARSGQGAGSGEAATDELTATGDTPAVTPDDGGTPAEARNAPDALGGGQDGGKGGHPVHRPGDLAREALRSARAEAQRARAAAERHGAGDTKQRRRSTPPAPSRMPRTAGADRAEAEVRARAVRDMLADAFRMPDAADAPDRGTDDNVPTSSEVRSSSARTAPTAPTGPSGSSGARQAAAPRSMAAPARDSDLRRTFPAFPPRSSGSETFAETWWGNAWVTALEEGALDAARLARGRGYAEQGNVDAITVTPGLVLAYVQGSRPRPYRVQVRLRTFSDADWERFLDAAADRPGHIAALLDKEMPQSLADCGVPLLPGPGDLDPHCSCPDRGHPCKHAAALCYQTARLLDADPFVLLLLRGRGERTVIDALSRRSATRAARAAQDKEPQPLPGVRA